MKKFFTLLALLCMMTGTMLAQAFPGDPGELVIDLKLHALTTEGDTLAAYTPQGAGAYTAGDTVQIAALEIPGYTFLYWSDQDTNAQRSFELNENMELVAYYEQEYYRITFNDGESDITTFELAYGAIPEAPENPVREETAQYRFIFQGWSPQIVAVTGPATYTAVFDTIIQVYAVRFVDWNDSILQADSLEYGAMPQYREGTPTHEMADGMEFTFNGWEPELATVEGDATYYAMYDERMLEYNVTVIRNNDTIYTNVENWGFQGTFIAEEITGYHFVGWDNGITNDTLNLYVYSDTTVRANYEINKYAIRFVDWDETLLQADTLEHGTMPQYSGETPVRASENGIEYTFASWTPELQEATADLTYMAQYTETQIEYIVTLILDGDTTIQSVFYNTELDLLASDKSDRHFTNWSDGNMDAERHVTIISDTTFTAIYGASYVDIHVAPNQWTFFCLPEIRIADGWSQDMFNTSNLTDVAYGTYNSIIRAAGQSGWETPEAFNAKQGYIVYSSTEGNLRLNIYPENIVADEVNTNLNLYPAEHSQNANWNFVGNPFNAQITAASIEVTGSDAATATIWNGTGYDNELLSSESLIFTPLQAFFIQVEEEGSLTFTYNVTNPGGAPRRNAPAQVEENSRIDIRATAGGYTDKARVLFHSNSSLRYEAGRDASKFITATAPIQMYLLDIDNVQCAQMVRPSGEDNIRLGYMLREAGDIEVNIPVYAENYELFDALTGNSYSLNEQISLYSEAGTHNDRLILRPVRKVATIIPNTSEESKTTKLIINGELFLLRDGKMYTIQGIER